MGPAAGHPDAIVARSRVRLRSFQDEFQISEEESIRHLTFLVEEFFGLLITILGERFIPGMGDVGVEDMVRKEIVQLLCVEPMYQRAFGMDHQNVQEGSGAGGKDGSQ